MNTITPKLETPKRHHTRRVPAKRRLHLRLVEGAAVISFDHPDKSANVIDAEFLNELETALRAVVRYGVKGLVFVSSKPSVFLAGADLESLGKLHGEALEAVVARGQAVFSRIASLGMPTIAAIHGACLGGGLELALACDRRIASDDPATKLGLPETQLGLLPAWGGSTRLPRLIGLPKALDLILNGIQVTAKHASKLGVVDEVVPKERLTERAIALLDKTVPKRKSFFLTNNPISAVVIRSLTKRQLLAKTRGNYPAPLAALEVVGHGSWVTGGNLGRSFSRERDAFVRLAETDAARNLLRLFFLQEKAKHYRHDPSLDPKTLPRIERTAVIGAGVMGAGIAQMTASRGVPVILADLDPGRVAAGMKSVSGLFAEAVKRRIFTTHEARRKFDLVTPSAERVPLHRCDLVIEAAIEDLEVKKKIFADLCARTAPGTILATNTSALSVTELAKAEGITHPERVIGLHFFNPVSRMKLVEIITTEFTTPEVVERALAFVRALGKTPVVVKDSPGFLVNRILMPYLIEAGRLAEAGVPVATIDEAMLDFGMPMGPLRLLDEIGLDVATHVADTMVTSFGERFAPPLLLADLVRAGHLGRKSGRGFYRHDDGKAAPDSFAKAPRDLPDKTRITTRLNQLMVEESKRCLAEGLVRDADTVDLAIILGTGYAPFRGGPLHGTSSSLNRL
jgi:3-hydroxyacyl-CoA dehydrogenase/enoyl-CoA hydratase/3-hydroxybutyryl-CoA epimerase